MSILTATMLCSKLAFGYLTDVVDNTALVIGIAATQLAAYVILAVGAQLGGLCLAAVLIGIFGGGQVVVISMLTLSRFGAASFGSVWGMILFVSGFFGTPMVRIAGAVYDRTHSYNLAFLGLCAATILAAFLLVACQQTAVAGTVSAAQIDA